MKAIFLPEGAETFFSRSNLVEIIKEMLSGAKDMIEGEDEENPEPMLAKIEELVKLDHVCFPDELLMEFAKINWEHMELDSISDDCADDRYMDRADIVLKYYNLPTYSLPENE